MSRELSIIVTSHILAEIERVAHRVAILLDGKLLTVHTLECARGSTRLRVRLRGADDAALRSAFRARAGSSASSKPLPALGVYVLDSAQGAGRRGSGAGRRAGFAVEEVSAAGSGLEELFLRLTEGAQP